MRTRDARLLRAVLLGLGLLVVAPAPARPKPKPKELTFGGFGRVAVVHPPGEPRSVVIFLSGDGGWTAGVVDMGNSLAREGALVLGVNTPRYLQSLSKGTACANAAKDLEELSVFAQKQLGLPRYLHPVVVGYSSGATIAYAALAQSSAGTYLGGMSLGFCPDQEMATPLCELNGLTRSRTPDGKSELLSAVKALPAPWYVLGGNIDETCPLPNVQTFAKDMDNAHVVELDKVGHGFSKPKHWLREFLDSFRAIPVELEPGGAATAPPDGGVPDGGTRGGGPAPAAPDGSVP